MKILCFGSLNIDHVYQLEHITRPGETLASYGYQQFCGGKGLNQSIALSRAKSQVWHAGMAGKDGTMLLDLLKENNVNTDYVKIDDSPSGHAVIQVEKGGQNSIIIHGGTNRLITTELASNIISNFEAGDIILLQNEISSTPAIMEIASQHGLRIFFNPAPMDDSVKSFPLDLIDTFIVNEIEGAQLSGESKLGKVLEAMVSKYPASATLLTLGSKGAVYGHGQVRLGVKARQVKAQDTTAAGDTFIGFFISQLAKGQDIQTCLDIASKAAAISVSRRGASSSIPFLDEL
jgi:ribokinase